MKSDFFAMSGQSNMQGQSESYVPFEAPASACREYKILSDRFETVKNPSGEDVRVNGEELLLGAHQGFSSPVPYFADEFYKISGFDATYAHVAKGATIVKQWLPGTNRYNMLIEKLSKALKKAEDEGIEIVSKNFVWLQGESDAIENNTRVQYKKELIDLWEHLKKDLGFEKFMMIRVGYFYEFPCERIMLAQEELCRERDDFYMLTDVTASFTIENGLMQRLDQAGFHYTNKGYEVVGREAGAAAARILHG